MGDVMKKSLLILSLLICLSLLGCGNLSTSSGNETAGSSSSEATAIGRYWDFDDVLVPSSMKLEKEKSMIFISEGNRGGLLVFSDNIEINSLVNFFNLNMSKDNWLHKASFKYPNVAMFFAKPDKTCTIHINETSYSTTVFIWVAPTVGARP